MIIQTPLDRLYYMKGYFARVCKNPENYIKEDLIFYIKELRKFIDSPDNPLDDSIIGRSLPYKGV